MAGVRDMKTGIKAARRQSRSVHQQTGENGERGLRYAEDAQRFYGIFGILGTIESRVSGFF